MTAAAFTRTQIACVMALGTIAACMPTLQPVLLGALLADGRIDTVTVGRAGTLEGLGMLAAALITTAFARPVRLPAWGAGAAVAIVLANAATASLPAGGILVARMLGGAGSGVMLWVLIGLMKNVAQPGRLFAIYVTVQATTAFLLSILFSQYVVPTLGAQGAYGAIAAIGLALVPASLLLPRRYPHADDPDRFQVPTRKGLFGLAAIAFFMAGTLAPWIYLYPILAERGIDDLATGRVVSSAIAAQIVGALVSIWAVGKLPGWLGSAIGAVLAAAALGLLMASGASLPMIYAAASVFAFFWMFAPAFHLPLLLDIDVSGKTASYVNVAQLVGISVGPWIASIVVADTGVRQTMPYGIVGLAISLVLVLALTYRPRMAGAAPVE